MKRRILITVAFLALVIPTIAGLPCDTIYEELREVSTGTPHAGKVELKLNTYHNAYGSTTVGFSLLTRGLSLEICGADLLLGDGGDYEILRTISPLRYSVVSSGPEEVVKTTFKVKFPYYKSIGGKDDMLRIFTDKGVLHLYLDDDRRAEELLANQRQELGVKYDKLEKRTDYLKYVLVLALLAFVALLWVIRRRKRRYDAEIYHLTLLLSENKEQNRDLCAKVDSLYRQKFGTLNLLCNEYFEKGASESLRLTIFREVEKEILKLKDHKCIVELESAVNEYMGGIMSKVRSQIPELSNDEFAFLVYLYSGLSARAICILTGIRVKNFYARRQRLKDKILNSGAADAALFAEKM